MSRLGLTLLLLAIALAVIGGHYLLWSHLFVNTALPGGASIVLVAIYFALIGSFIATRLVLRDRVHWFGWLGYTTLGFVAMLFLCACLAYPLRLFILGGSEVAGLPVDGARAVLLARVLGGATTLTAGILTVIGVRNALSGPEVRDVEIPLARLPRAMDGYTIVQISDVHLGRTLGRDFARRLVGMSNALGADLIVITGDLVDGSVAQLHDVVAPFGELSARHGVYMVTGNHEYYVGADEWITELGRLKIRVLRNERVTIGAPPAAFDLAGVDDWEANGEGHGHDLDRAVAGRDPERPLIVLAHQPRTILKGAHLGIDLQLSGHTHGGQIWNYLVRLQQPYMAGLHHHGETVVCVNRGAGYWGPPMRLGTRAEILRIVLRTSP